MDSEERTKKFVVEKMDEMATLIRHERVHQRQEIESTVRKAVREELKETYFSKKVRRSAEELDEAAEERKSFLTPEEHEAVYKSEEARVLKNLRDSGRTLETVNSLNRRMKARKARKDKEKADKEIEAE